MGSGDHLEVVGVVELFGDVLAEGVSSASGVHAPAGAVIRIGPQEIAHGTFMGDFLEALQSTDVVQSLNTGGESSVEAEELVLNNCSEGEEIEEFSEALPHIGVAVLPAALIVKSINLGDLARFVITSQDGQSVFVAHLQRDQQRDCLHTVVT